DRLLLTEKPSFGRRAARGLLRFFVLFFLGVAATLAWQSYGDATRQSIAAWAAERGWPTDWLYDGQAQKQDPPPRLPPSAPPAPRRAQPRRRRRAPTPRRAHPPIIPSCSSSKR